MCFLVKCRWNILEIVYIQNMLFESNTRGLYISLIWNLLLSFVCFYVIPVYVFPSFCVEVCKIITTKISACKFTHQAQILWIKGHFPLAHNSPYVGMAKGGWHHYSSEFVEIHSNSELFLGKVILPKLALKYFWVDNDSA